MSQLIQPIINFLHFTANILPLPAFALLGAIIEEIVAPIPSPLVMTLTGSLAAADGRSPIYLIFLIFIGTIGKTIGSLIVYFIADKGKDIIVGKFGKVLGVSHREIEAIGKHLNKGWKDDLFLFLLRAAPIMPTAPVSIVCGLLKINLRTYIVSTFFGVALRSIFYFYLGYTGVGALESINEGVGGLEKIGYLILLIAITGVLFVIYRNRRKGEGIKFLEKNPNKVR